METGRLLQVPGQFDLHSEFHIGQDYIAKLCLKKKSKERERKTERKRENSYSSVLGVIADFLKADAGDYVG